MVVDVEYDGSFAIVPYLAFILHVFFTYHTYVKMVELTAVSLLVVSTVGGVFCLRSRVLLEQPRQQEPSICWQCNA